MASYEEDYKKLLEIFDINPKIIMGHDHVTEVAKEVLKGSVRIHQTAVNKYITSSDVEPSDKFEEIFTRNMAALVDDARLYGILEDDNPQDSS